MDQRQVIDDRLYAHFITFSVDRRRRLLDHEQAKRLLLGVLNEQLVVDSARCVGFVVMPDHVHAIVWFPVTGQLSTFMHGWKRKSSYHMRNWYRAEASDYAREYGESDRFWQPKYHAFQIETEKKLREKLDYVHLNPVRAGLVEKTTDYAWSSARWYELGKSVGVPIQWID